MLVKASRKYIGEIDPWSLRRSSMHERSFNRIRGCLKEKDKKWKNEEFKKGLVSNAEIWFFAIVTLIASVKQIINCLYLDYTK